MKSSLWILLLILPTLVAAEVSRAIILEGAELITVEGPAAASADRHPEVLSEQLYKRQEQVTDIYNEFYFADPTVTGEILIQFTLEANGKVSGCVPLKNTTGSAELARRICEQIMKWELPGVTEAELQSWALVTVPYEFLPLDEPAPAESD